MRTPTQLADLEGAALELARLVPAVYLARDQEVDGHPLLVLLQVLAGPLDELDSAIDELHDDHFVERASPEAVRALADLVGARLLSDDPRTSRAVVARTIGWRRRKGNVATLEEVLSLTSGWSTEADEGFRSLLTTQDFAHLVPWRGRDAVLWDPIALADPLSRRFPSTQWAQPSRRSDLVARRRDESIDDALRRLGAADAGRRAVSPRTVDLLGWAQSDRVVLRSSRIVVVEFDDVELDDGRLVPHRHDITVNSRGYAVDPLDRTMILAGWRLPEQRVAMLSDTHEPTEEPVGVARYGGLLTPTELASRDAESDDFDDITVLVDDVVLAGADRRPGVGDDLAFAPVGREPMLRFADRNRPSPADRWTLELVALETAGEVPLVSTVAGRGGRDPEVVTSAASLDRAGATVAVAISRASAGHGYRRDGAGTWTLMDVGEPTGATRSDLAVVSLGAGGRAVVRVEEAPGGGLQLGVWRPDQPSQWVPQVLDLGGLAQVDRPDVDAAKDGAAVSAVGVGSDLVFVAPTVVDPSGTQPQTLGVWRVADAGDGGSIVTRIDGDANVSRRPLGRMAPALCVHDDSVFVHGGEFGSEAGPANDGRLAHDMWSVPLIGPDAGRWIPHFVRNRQRRVGGRLLSTADGLVLLGGASAPGSLDPTVVRVDLRVARPAWATLAELPIAADRPGVLWARVVGDAIEAVVWADRVAPQRHLLQPGDRAWVVDQPEPDAPNPPADGEAIFDGDELLAPGPSPLPPSEVVFRIDGRGHVAYLPAIDLASVDDRILVRVRDDGSTIRVLAPGEVDRRSLRIGAGRDASLTARDETCARLAVPGRLGWQRVVVRQLNLESWDRPFALDLDDIVGVDPRLGRILVREELAAGRVSASFRVARAANVGVGFGPIDRDIPDAWREPTGTVDDERFAVQVPPDHSIGIGAAIETSAWVGPRRAGLTGADGVPVVATLGEAVAPRRDAYSVGVLGSPLLPADRLVVAESAVVTVWSADRARPHVAEDDGVSLVLGERGGPGLDRDPNRGPSWFLAGLSLAGALDLAVSGGVLDLRWCTIGVPGEIALRAAGAGHQPSLLRQSIPRPRVTVRLYGCQLGRIEIPPWVELIAAGCTFDGGGPDRLALDAAGASVRLRHCTINGQTRAGRFEASSSVLVGSVTCDRPDLGFTRYSLVARGGRPPMSFRGLTGSASFVSVDPMSPYYLVLAANNGTVATAGEQGLTPGAHHDRAQRAAELIARAEDFVPLALVPFHVDRTVGDLHRTHRRTA